jgi:hypothetical protein
MSLRLIPLSLCSSVCSVFSVVPFFLFCLSTSPSHLSSNKCSNKCSIFPPNMCYAVSSGVMCVLVLGGGSAGTPHRCRQGPASGGREGGRRSSALRPTGRCGGTIAHLQSPFFLNVRDAPRRAPCARACSFSRTVRSKPRALLTGVRVSNTSPVLLCVLCVLCGSNIFSSQSCAHVISATTRLLLYPASCSALLPAVHWTQYLARSRPVGNFSRHKNVKNVLICQRHPRTEVPRIRAPREDSSRCMSGN